MERRSEEWFEARKGLATGSSVGAILGLDQNRSRDDVLRAMVREVLIVLTAVSMLLSVALGVVGDAITILLIGAVGWFLSEKEKD